MECAVCATVKVHTVGQKRSGRRFVCIAHFVLSARWVPWYSPFLVPLRLHTALLVWCGRPRSYKCPDGQRVLFGVRVHCCYSPMLVLSYCMLSGVVGRGIQCMCRRLRRPITPVCAHVKKWISTLSSQGGCRATPVIVMIALCSPLEARREVMPTSPSNAHSKRRVALLVPLWWTLSYACRNI